MDAGGRAMQEQLPSLPVVNEHLFGKFNDARASTVLFQRFLKPIAPGGCSGRVLFALIKLNAFFVHCHVAVRVGINQYPLTTI